jgi:hypothetical protein
VEKRGTIQAANEQEAYATIQRNGLVPTRVFAVDPPKDEIPELAASGPAPPVKRKVSGSGVLSLILSIVALAVALGSLAWQFFRGDSLGHGLSHYDFSTPEKALLAQGQMRLNHDLRAEWEYYEKMDGGLQKERLDTLKVEKQRIWNKRVILFISYKQKGVERKDINAFRKSKKMGFWVPDYGFNDFQIRGQNPTLADEIVRWRQQNPPPRFEDDDEDVGPGDQVRVKGTPR